MTPLFHLPVGGGWTQQLLPLQLNPSSPPVSVFDTLFGLMPKLQSAPSPDFIFYFFACLVHILKTGCKFKMCVSYYYFLTISQMFAALKLLCGCITQVSLLQTGEYEARHFHICVALFWKNSFSRADTRPADGCWVFWPSGVFVCWSKSVLFVLPWICN